MHSQVVGLLGRALRRVLHRDLNLARLRTLPDPPDTLYKGTRQRNNSAKSGVDHVAHVSKGLAIWFSPHLLLSQPR